MWRLWSEVLEELGRIRLRFGFGRTRVKVGHRDALDAMGTGRWREYLDAERLYDVWAPVPGSPWTPYHCVPLFAALDRIPREDVGPALDRYEAGVAGLAPGPPPPPVYARAGAPAPSWATPDSWIILDLPGPMSVDAAAWLVTSAGCQPICTFDNWPHPKGLLRVEDTLAALLRWASTIEDARPTLAVDAPPLWICDSERLGTRRGSPGEFDNRYYLDDSVLPGLRMLAATGVRRVTYVTFGEPNVPILDLEAYFAELLAAGIPIEHVDLMDQTMTARPLAVRATRGPLRKDSFRRSAAGGFGSEVPQPSSGGS